MTVAPELGPELTTFDFEAFVARHSLRLRTLVLRRIGDPHEAEEVLQEALLRAHQHRHQFADDDGAAAWTTVVAQRLVIDRQRVSGRSVAVESVPESARLGRDTADIVTARAELRAALDALEALPNRQAAILWAREVEGLSYDEIAERFDLSEPTVRSVLHRGRKALRREFVKRGHAVPVAGLFGLAPLLRTTSPDWLRSIRRVAESKLLAVGAAAALAVGIVGGGYWMAEPATPPAGDGTVTFLPAGEAPAVPPAAVVAPRPAEVAPAGVAGVAGTTEPRRRPAPAEQLPTVCAGPACARPATNPEGRNVQVPLPVEVMGQQSVVVTTDAVPERADDMIEGVR